MNSVEEEVTRSSRISGTESFSQAIDRVVAQVRGSYPGVEIVAVEAERTQLGDWAVAVTARRTPDEDDE